MVRSRDFMRAQAGFSLIELSVVIVVLTLLLGAILVPLNTQLEQQRRAENKERIASAKEALYAFAVANGRLPCPDDPATTPTSAPPGTTGSEEFVPVTGNAGNGQCAVFDGFLPGKDLGLNNLDSGGHFMDGWGAAQNRMRYAVTNATVTVGALPVTNVFTRTTGMKTIGVAAFGGFAAGLYVCTNSTAITAANCGPGAALGDALPLAAGNAVAVLYSLGRNAPEVVSGALVPDADEQANLNGDIVFVMHDPSAVAGTVFDDQVEWVGGYALLSQMLNAGVLP